MYDPRKKPVHRNGVAPKVMIELLVKCHGIHWAGWLSAENLKQAWMDHAIKTSFMFEVDERRWVNGKKRYVGQKADKIRAGLV